MLGHHLSYTLNCYKKSGLAGYKLFTGSQNLVYAHFQEKAQIKGKQHSSVRKTAKSRFKTTTQNGSAGSGSTQTARTWLAISVRFISAPPFVSFVWWRPIAADESSLSLRYLLAATEFECEWPSAHSLMKRWRFPSCCGYLEVASLEVRYGGINSGRSVVVSVVLDVRLVSWSKSMWLSPTACIQM